MKTRIDHAPAWVRIVYGKGRAAVTAYFHDTHTETGKFIYKALALHDKQLFLKRDRLRSHKSAVYHKRRKFRGVINFVIFADARIPRNLIFMQGI